MMFAKILSVFGISLIGYFANKRGWLPIASSRYFSILLVNISSPCLVLYSMSAQEMSEKALENVFHVASLMLSVLVVSTILSMVLVKIMRVPDGKKGVYSALLILTNNGFMGYPLSYAVFGKQGLFLMIVANAVFTFYLYSVGAILLIYDGEGQLNIRTTLRSIVSIPVVASLIGIGIFVMGIKLPPLFAEFLKTVGDITIPLSMIIIGIQLAESKVKEVLNNKQLIYILILKLVILPAILFGIFMWIPVDPFVFVVVIFAMAMPSAAVVPVLAEIYHADAKTAAQNVFVTTMFSLGTIPIWGILLIQYINR